VASGLVVSSAKTGTSAIAAVIVASERLLAFESQNRGVVPTSLGGGEVNAATQFRGRFGQLTRDLLSFGDRGEGVRRMEFVGSCTYR
jgi:hypothetical protein